VERVQIVTITSTISTERPTQVSKRKLLRVIEVYEESANSAEPEELDVEAAMHSLPKQRSTPRKITKEIQDLLLHYNDRWLNLTPAEKQKRQVWKSFMASTDIYQGRMIKDWLPAFCDQKLLSKWGATLAKKVRSGKIILN